MEHKSDITDRLRAVFAKELERHISTIGPSTRLKEELVLSSLDLILSVFRIEDEFDLHIPDDDLQHMMTVADMVRYLTHRLQTKDSRSMLPVANVSARMTSSRQAMGRSKSITKPDFHVNKANRYVRTRKSGN